MNSSISLTPVALIWVAILSIFCGCSSGDALAPESLEVPSAGIDRETDSGHSLLAYVHVIPDIENMKIDIVPRRTTEIHFNLKSALTPPNCYGCIQFTLNSFDQGTRIMDVDVMLKNPTFLSGYDVRGILIANNTGHEMRNADDWTKLYDDGQLPDINPFKAFDVDDPNRQFNSYETDTQQVLFHLPQPPNWPGFDYAVDASWPGHCKEPYEIVNFVQSDPISKLFDVATLNVDVHDWQNNVTEVSIDVTEIMGDVIQLSNTLGDTWSGDVTNVLLPPPGVYSCLVSAYSPNGPGWWLYDYVDVLISEPLYLDRIAFASNRTGDWDIFMMNPDGSNQEQITWHNADDTSPAFSPNELKIVFQTNRDQMPGVNHELYIYDIMFETPAKETDQCYTLSPDWSPNDDIIYITRFANCIDIVSYHFAHFKVGSPDVTHEALGPQFNNFLDVQFNDSGSKVLFSAATIGEFIFEADYPNFSSVEQLTDHGTETNCSYSPDGTMIAYTSVKDSNTDIYIMDLSSGFETRMTFDPGIDAQPTWSPDSDKIAYIHYFDDLGEHTSIFVLAVDGSYNVEVSQNTDSSDLDPDWSGNIFY